MTTETATDEEPAWVKLHNKLQDHYADERQQVLDKFSPEIQAIIKEAAIAGFFSGLLHSVQEGKVQMPPDSEILDQTMMVIVGFSDLYPTISGKPDADEDEDQE